MIAIISYPNRVSCIQLLYIIIIIIIIIFFFSIIGPSDHLHLHVWTSLEHQSALYCPAARAWSCTTTVKQPLQKQTWEVIHRPLLHAVVSARDEPGTDQTTTRILIFGADIGLDSHRLHAMPPPLSVDCREENAVDWSERKLLERELIHAFDW